MCIGILCVQQPKPFLRKPGNYLGVKSIVRSLWDFTNREAAFCFKARTFFIVCKFGGGGGYTGEWLALWLSAGINQRVLSVYVWGQARNAVAKTVSKPSVQAVFEGF